MHWVFRLFQSFVRGSDAHPSLQLEEALIGKWQGQTYVAIPIPHGAMSAPMEVEYRADNTYSIVLVVGNMTVTDIGRYAIRQELLYHHIEDTDWVINGPNADKARAKFLNRKQMILEAAQNEIEGERVYWRGPNRIRIFANKKPRSQLKRVLT